MAEAMLERFLRGEPRALARTISWLENGDPAGQEVLRHVYDRTGRAHIVGITGSPGVGKSTLVDQIALEFRRHGKRVGILAIDPTSPFSGGSVLGDRIRMQSAQDPGVFMRSLAARGHLGGLSAATDETVRAMDAFGFDVILIETVGAGQSEVEIMEVAQTTLVVLAPGLGDDIQAIKAGILEIGDIFVVNKADRDGANRTVTELRGMLQLGRGRSVPADAETLQHHGAAALSAGASPAGSPGASPAAAGASAKQPAAAEAAWEPPVLQTIARDGTGIAELVAAISDHRAHLQQAGQLGQWERRRAAARLRRLVLQAVDRHVFGGAEADALIEAVARREQDPYSAAEALLRKAGLR